MTKFLAIVCEQTEVLYILHICSITRRKGALRPNHIFSLDTQSMYCTVVIHIELNEK